MPAIPDRAADIAVTPSGGITAENVQTALEDLDAAVGGGSSQPLDATLTALAALGIVANSLTIGTGTDAFSQTTFAANTFPARASSGNLVAKPIADGALAFLASGSATNITSGNLPVAQHATVVALTDRAQTIGGAGNAAWTFNGQILVNTGSASSPCIAALSNTNTGLYYGADYVVFSAQGVPKFFAQAATNRGFVLSSNMPISWGSNTSAIAVAPDVYIHRSAANVLKVTTDGSSTLASFDFKHIVSTVAALPAAGTAGRCAFATNGRKNGEGAGVGTGVLVFDDGTAWRACDTGATVAA